MLRPVKCSIISSARNGQVDAYVLSESSMFVSQRRFILKTCGTTTPLQCIQELLGLVKVYAGFDTIEASPESGRRSELRNLAGAVLPKKKKKKKHLLFLPFEILLPSAFQVHVDIVFLPEVCEERKHSFGTPYD